MTRLLFFGLMVLTLSSCGLNNMLMDKYKHIDLDIDAMDSTFLYDFDYEYQIRRGDKISISVWGHDDLSVGSTYGIYNSNEVYGKWLMVDELGEVSLPRIGPKYVQGMTIIALKEFVTEELTKVVRNPVVDIKILNREITIIGAVRNAMVLNVDREDDNRLLKLVARCGGFDFHADLRYIKIIRPKGDDVKITYIDISDPNDYLARDIQLFPGDMVVVPTRKHKSFDNRVTSIIPFATIVTATAILIGTFGNK